MDPKVTAYIDNLDQCWQVEVCTRLRHIIHQVIPEVEERIHYHRLHFLLLGRDTCAMAGLRSRTESLRFWRARWRASTRVC